MNASSSRDDGSTLIDDADLYKAAAEGRFEKFENYAHPLDHLLSHKKNTILHVHLKSPCGRSKEFVEKVLDKCPELLLQSNNYGDIPLHIAAKYVHVDVVKVFIEEAKKSIHRDLETGEEEAVRRMLRLTNKQKDTALHLAVRGNSCNVVQEILEHEDPNFTYTANASGETPLYLAIDEEHDDIAIEILNKFESPDCGGPNGRTVFHVAASHYFNDRCLDLLLSKVGSLVNQADESGWTPLHYAAYSYRPWLVRKILGEDKHSAYATDKYWNRTALHMASCRGFVEIMEEIIDKCPECCEITDVRGWNILHYAVISKYELAVQTILKVPSLMYLLKEPDIKGYTPFQLLVVSRPNSFLFSWIRNKSDVPSDFVYNGFYYFDYKDREEILVWMKDLGTDPFGKKIVVNRREEIEKEREERVIPELEKAKDSHLVAAALVATVTFAAAFTLPGGYISDENDSNLKGTPILTKDLAFKAFVVTDAIAMVLSTSSVLIHYLMVMLGYKQRYYWLARSAFWFVVLAIGAMIVAFVTGTYAVLATPSKGLAISICLIGLTFFLHAAYATIRLVEANIIENHGLSTTEYLRWLLLSAPQYLC